ncbi:PEP/pyruvate-binding domain-containing protein [Bacillus altitudinis]|uniref:PEP/pyruvate-binding domain-containing protein n=1 Tax=Bacillus altitudinis TaxID=293387 RepID=UPI00201FF910|nr:PEP/pyruvate-binding domain-containing protein [Bacillus altitudinis]MCL7872794.1 PEP-utilizing enzyme [Bacillus altitudinis]
MYSVLFHAAEESASLAGAKGVNLIKLNNHGLPVPDGFIIKTNSFASFLSYHNFHPTDQNLARKITEASFPSQMETELLSSFQSLLKTYPSVAVRSSSVAEDLEGASFAGQYETYLNIKTNEEFLQAVKECWSSYFAARVTEYKEEMIENEEEMPLMAVVVQGLIHSDISGVIFSENPVSGKTNEVMMTASYGLGEAIVSGLVTPDTFIVNKETYSIEKSLGTKEVQIVPCQEGVIEQPVGEEMAGQFCLQDDQLIQITKMTKQVEELYGHGVDIEFGMSDGTFYLLQARPITASFSNTANGSSGAAFQMKPEELQDFWISMDDHMPGPTSPLFSSLIIPALKNGMKKNGEKYQVPDLNIKDIKLYRGHLYSSPSMPEASAEPVFDDSLFEMFPRLSERMYRILKQNLFPLYEKLDQQITRPLTIDDAINGFQELKEIYLRAYDDHFDIVIPQVILSAIIEDMLVTYTGDQTQVVLLHEMMIGVMNKSLETDQKLSHLAKDVLQDSELLQAFTDHSANAELLYALNHTEKGKNFISKVEDFLQVYGWRSVKSHDFTEETWVENPEFVLDIIRNNIRHQSDFDEEFAQAVIKRQETYEQFISQVTDEAFKTKFEELYHFALHAANIRDDHHFYIDAMLDAKARLYLLKIGELLVQKGAIPHQEDLWYLYDDEVLNALTTSTTYDSIIQQRKIEMKENESIQPPAYTGTPSEAELQQVERMLGSLRENENNTDDAIYGIGASSGITSGRVRVITSADEFSQFEKDDILVCKTTTPLWTSLFRDAKAVITDSGGILSHSAIIAREYMIPAVLGTRIATEKLKSGDLVTVDGANGRIQLLNQHSRA